MNDARVEAPRLGAVFPVGLTLPSTVARIRRDPTSASVVGLALLAAGLTALRLSRPAGLLYASSFDTSIYLGSAIRLVHGVLPYRDFVMLQPPGSVLLMTPFALISKVLGSRAALVMVNLCTPLLAFVDVALVGRLVRHRGWRAAAIACGFVAVCPFLYNALLNGMLEPLMVLFCLLGAILLFERDRLSSGRRIALGGLAFGFAGSVLVAAIVPTLVAGALCCRSVRGRLLPFAGGVAAGFLIPALPFFVAAPGAFLRDVVFAQLGRASGAQRTDVMLRLSYMTFGGKPLLTILTVGAVVATVVLAFTLVRRGLTALDWYVLATAVAMVALQFAIANYWDHFGVMLLPYTALLVGISAHRLMSWRRRWGALLLPALAAVLGAIVLATVVQRIESEAGGDYGPAIDAVVPPGGCALSDLYPLLVMSDRFSSNVPACTPMVDAYATRLVYAYEPTGALAFDAAISHADYLVLSEPLDKALWGSDFEQIRARVGSEFHPVRSGGLLIYVRNSRF